ncbi:pyridoxal phosphate-dependent transferase [Lobosporangium transversale]|uniref:Pyridoxal phosphate-dependent transferase n=1 Tax=Lobosporangium transversale TaxID=64571 RepID=A0A1Y2GQ82_9FUNG|nr:pyridoxal phosphate-dependent transferase [Lobosporangium transversale]ORZ16084.1 pyridoxal phosphate-dependent transferase [Lobosporangium transversale]|eukprot:XP_021881431.1 pyridoxal phosphate-dependent transferase [Lobosporangium transversale]
MLKWHDYAEQNPDRWVRLELKPALRKIRSKLAAFMNCDTDELALVQNTTTGINAVLRSLAFAPGDKILQLSTGYINVDRTVHYICDIHKDVNIIEVPITMPMTDHEIVYQVEKTVQHHLAKKDQSRIRLAVIDWISSVPAIVHPVKPLVDMLKSYGILVLVDGAHAIGQVPVDLKFLNADFFITNCHKWLYSVRGSAALYVPKRLQGLIHPTAIQGDYKNGFEAEFSWNGTMDYSSMLSIEGALEFREQYGEEAIMHYMHTLAVRGGEIMVEILGTQVMTPYDHQVGSMVNIRLPIKNINHPKIETPDYLVRHLLDKYNLFSPSYKHGGYFWTRVSAQIYLEFSDFVHLAHVWKEVIEELNNEDQES